VDAEVAKYIELLDFESKANSFSHTLSGGMKRKLSVGVALCGGSKVLTQLSFVSGSNARF